MKIFLPLLQIFEAASFYLSLPCYVPYHDRRKLRVFFRERVFFSNTLIATGRIIELTSSYFVDDWQTAINIITIFTRTDAGVGRVAGTISRDNSCTHQMARSGPLSREIVALALETRWVNGTFPKSVFRYFLSGSCRARRAERKRERLEKIYCSIKNLFTIVLDRPRAYPNHNQTTNIDPSTESNYLVNRR